MNKQSGDAAQFAEVNQNERMISVESLSGSVWPRPEDEEISFFDLDVLDEVLGAAIMGALNRSRFVNSPDFFKVAHDFARSREKQTVKRSGFRTLKRTYENMKYISISRRSGSIFMRLHYAEGGFWVTLPEDHQVVIPADSSAQQVGAAARLGLSQCKPIA